MMTRAIKKEKERDITKEDWTGLLIKFTGTAYPNLKDQHLIVDRDLENVITIKGQDDRFVKASFSLIEKYNR